MYVPNCSFKCLDKTDRSYLGTGNLEIAGVFQYLKCSHSIYVLTCMWNLVLNRWVTLISCVETLVN